MFPYKTWASLYFDTDLTIKWDFPLKNHIKTVKHTVTMVTHSIHTKLWQSKMRIISLCTINLNCISFFICPSDLRFCWQNNVTNTITQHVSTWPCREPSSACGAALHPSSSSDEGLCEWRVLDISVQRRGEKHFIDDVITHIHNVSTKRVIWGVHQAVTSSVSSNWPVWWSPVWCCVRTPGSRWRSVSSAAFLCERSAPDPPEW